MKKINIILIFNSIPTNFLNEELLGLSGGDRITIESLRNWKDKINCLRVITCNSGKLIIEKYIPNLDHEGVKINLINTPQNYYNNTFILFIYKTIKGILLAKNTSSAYPDNTIIFSCSDIFPDVLPAFLARIKKGRNIRWAAAFYLFAASPWSKKFPYRGFKASIRGAIYYYTQRICYFLIRKFADYVVACNEIDRKIFIKDGYPEDKICAIYGGVDLRIPESVPAPDQPVYEGAFMARFHPQKAPLLAVKVWSEVTKILPKAKLAMIGNGPEEGVVKKFIEENHLRNSVTLFGFKDGVEKYQILKSSRIFIDTSIYDTGAMAAIEGMAAGLPLIAFDQEGYKYTYPKGLIKVSPIGDFRKMALAIVGLLKNKIEYEQFSKEAGELAKEWEWSKRCAYLLNNISKNE